MEIMQRDYIFRTTGNVVLNNGVYTITGDATNGKSNFVQATIKELRLGDYVTIEFEMEGDDLEISMDSWNPIINQFRVYNMPNKKQQKVTFHTRFISESHIVKIGHFTNKTGITNISNIKITTNGICSEPKIKTSLDIYSFMLYKETGETSFKTHNSFTNNIDFTLSNDNDTTIRLTYSKPFTGKSPITNIQMTGLGNGAEYRVLVVSSTLTYCTFRIVKYADNSYVNTEGIIPKLLYLSGTIIS